MHIHQQMNKLANDSSLSQALISSLTMLLSTSNILCLRMSSFIFVKNLGIPLPVKLQYYV